MLRVKDHFSRAVAGVILGIQESRARARADEKIFEQITLSQRLRMAALPLVARLSAQVGVNLGLADITSVISQMRRGGLEHPGDTSPMLEGGLRRSRRPNTDIMAYSEPAYPTSLTGFVWRYHDSVSQG